MNSTRIAVSACRQLLVAAMLTVLSGAMGLPVPQAPGGARAAALEGQRFADTMVLSDRTLRLRLKVMLEAPSLELTKSMRNGVRRNEPQAIQTQLAERVELLTQGIDSIGDFQPGDVLDIDFVPGRGTELRLNDKLLTKAIVGDDFYRAILKIFIGERPVDRRMKEGLLSGTSS